MALEEWQQRIVSDGSGLGLTRGRKEVETGNEWQLGLGQGGGGSGSHISYRQTWPGRVAAGRRCALGLTPTDATVSGGLPGQNA
jgi:hypothetical protein